jgi:hypothetical protein
MFGGGQVVTSSVTDVVEEWKSTTTADPNSQSPLSAFDCGVIFLNPTNAAQVAGVRPASVFRTTIDQIRNVPVGFVGYPFDPRRPDLYFELAGGSCAAVAVTNPPVAYRVTYAIDSLEGMSGGPVYTLDPLERTLKIHAVDTSSYPSPAGEAMGNGLLIYEALAKKIGEWVQIAKTLGQTGP